MSRYGKMPVELPKNVDLKVEQSVLRVTGPKGTMDLSLKEGILLAVGKEQVALSVEENGAVTPAEHGLYRALIRNMVLGVSAGYEKKLQLVGVGYRASVQGHHLDLQIGFSHPTKVPIPKGVVVEVDKNVTIIVRGVDKRQVGQFAAVVRAKRPPEPYKGKGIRYENEYVRKKDGKAAKGKGA